MNNVEQFIKKIAELELNYTSTKKSFWRQDDIYKNHVTEKISIVNQFNVPTDIEELDRLLEYCNTNIDILNIQINNEFINKSILQSYKIAWDYLAHRTIKKVNEYKESSYKQLAETVNEKFDPPTEIPPTTTLKVKKEEKIPNEYDYKKLEEISKSNLYEDGMNIILQSSSLYLSPFVETGKQIIKQFEILEKHTPEDLPHDLIKNIPLVEFLSNYYEFSVAFVEKIAVTFSEIIRKNTIRIDIKERSTENIAVEIKEESFSQFKVVFGVYGSTMHDLGVQLKNVSSIKSAIQGTMLGGGLELMGSKGKSSGTGMVIGAVLGVAMAEAEKEQLREQHLKTAFNGIKETINALIISNQKLMDQYSSYIWGSKIDFEERDKQINRGKEVLEEIKLHCTIILENIKFGHTFWNNSILKINKAHKGISFFKFYGYGFGVLFAILAFIILPNFDLEKYPTLNSIVGLSLFVLPLLGYLYYKFVLKENGVKKQKGIILTEIKSNKSNFTKLENSILELEKCREKL